MIAVLQQPIDHRPQRRQPDAAGDDHHVPAFHGCSSGQPRPNGPAQPDHAAGSQPVDRPGDRAHHADRVVERVGALGSELMEMAASPTPGT